MKGFLDIKFSVFLRRLLTIIPSLVVIALKLDPLKILVLSQVALSFAIPFALVPLVILTRSRAVMADMANDQRTNVMAYVVTMVIMWPECSAAVQDPGRRILIRPEIDGTSQRGRESKEAGAFI